MKVIFLKDVPRVGKKNDVKELGDGYVMNFLLPRRLAVIATPKALAEFELRKKEITIEREVQEDLLIRNLEEIKGKTIVMKVRADEKGHLFSAIHEKAMVEAMKEQHHADISEEFIVLEKPVKVVGEFEIPLKIQDKKSFFKLLVEKI